MNAFIACSSSEKIDLKYLDLAKAVSECLINHDYDLVFGASYKSMMGVCYNTFINNNKQVAAISPDVYGDELSKLTKCKKIVTEDTITRFKEIYKLSNLIIILPGGIGSLAELSSTMEEARTIDNNKKVILFNFEGFYDDIIKWLEEKSELGFISNNIEQIINIVNNIDELKEKIGEN